MTLTTDILGARCIWYDSDRGRKPSPQCYQCNGYQRRAFELDCDKYTAPIHPGQSHSITELKGGTVNVIRASQQDIIGTYGN